MGQRAAWLIVVGLLSCTFVQPLDELSDFRCPPGQHACDLRCVPDGDPATGCGGPGCAPCQISHGMAACSPQGKCSIARCDDGYDDCDGDASNGCEVDLRSDVGHCGICARSCSGPRATMACAQGRCIVAGCDPNFADCNFSPADGCEAELAVSASHCGQCNRACDSGLCDKGACVVVTSVRASSSGRHACAALSNGQVFCWGDSMSAQIGPGCEKNCTQAVAIPGLPRVVAVAPGEEHTCALSELGQVFCWGANAFGQLGRGSAGSAEEPSPKVVPMLDEAVEISSGARHTCALSKQGAVWCWGAADAGQLGVGIGSGLLASPARAAFDSEPLLGVTALAAGGDTTCAVRQGGLAYCWGNNADGQLGIGKLGPTMCGASMLPCSTRPEPVANATGIVGVSCGGDATCFLRGSGQALCAGNGAKGRLGSGSEKGSFSPLPVSGVNALSSLSMGATHACAIQAPNHNLWCWGQNGNGQLFESNISAPFRLAPALVGSLANVEQVTAGAGFTCGLSAGSVLCVGANDAGQLGQGAKDSVAHSTPAKVVGLP